MFRPRSSTGANVQKDGLQHSIKFVQWRVIMMLNAETGSISYKNKQFYNTSSSVGSIVLWYPITAIISLS